MTITRGETYTDTFTFDIVIENPKAVQVTYRQGNYVIIQKQLHELTYELLYSEESHEYYATQITCNLSQEETFKFWANDDVLVQVRIITSDDKSLVFDIKKIKIKECLDCNILPLSEIEEEGNNQNEIVIPSESEPAPELA